jgi:MFS family permease
LAIGSLTSAAILKRIGSKYSLVIGSLSYFLFIASTGVSTYLKEINSSTA